MSTTAVVWTLHACRFLISKPSQVKYPINSHHQAFKSAIPLGVDFFPPYVYTFVFSATFKVPESVKWLKLNYKNTGFYAVHYKDESWAALGEALSHNVSVLTQEDRASLIHNIFALSKSVYVALSGLVVFSCFIFTAQFEEYSPIHDSPVASTDLDGFPSFVC